MKSREVARKVVKGEIHTHKDLRLLGLSFVEVGEVESLRRYRISFDDGEWDLIEYPSGKCAFVEKGGYAVEA
jgi:hypothetical protein